MSDNVTGPGVPLTTAQRVARYGARTRPTLRGGLPLFELDDNLEATYRETVLLDYEDRDAKGRKFLSDAKSWTVFAIAGAVIIPVVWTLALLGILTVPAAVTWTIPAAIAVVLSFPYRRVELRKHADLLEETREHLAPFINSGKARYI